MMYYQIKGKGKILFFIHGWGCDSRVWAKQKEALYRKYCVVTADLRGHGNSGWKSADNLLDAFATDILMLCKELNLREINFIGWSLGCYVIFELLENAPEIINSIVLVGGTPRFDRKNARFMRRRLNQDFNGALLDFRRSIFFENNEGPQPNKDALISCLNIFEHADFRDDIKKFDVPTLIVCGEDDSITPKAASEYLHKAIMGSTLVAVKDAGHVPFLTCPKEFNRVLEEWIDKR